MSELKTVEETTVAKPIYTRVRPRVDIVERENALMLMADMPGVSAETLDITLEQNQLTIHGNADAIERSYQLAFTLSKDIDRDLIEASVEHGVLTLTLPKIAEATPAVRQIEVKAA